MTKGVNQNLTRLLFATPTSRIKPCLQSPLLAFKSPRMEWACGPDSPQVMILANF